MKKRILSILLAMIMALSAVVSPAFAAARNVSNERYMYNYITQDMGLNSAVACGIMASAYIESGFNPTVSSTSSSYYGLFQWGGSRKSGLMSWCKSNGYDYTTMEGQMHYMEYELTVQNASYYHYSTLSAYPNTQQGAYDAAYTFMKYFEGCASNSYKEPTTGSSQTRMWAAANIFWPEYSSDSASGSGTSAEPQELTITMTQYPTGSIPQKAYTVAGTISPSSSIDWVQGYVTTADGGTVALDSGHKSSLSAVDNSLKFASLPAGYYTLTIVASNTAGKCSYWESPVFAVYSSSKNLRMFNDVSPSSWSYRNIYSAASLGLMNGTTATTFSPSSNLTRAQAAVVLCRLAGITVPASVSSTPFSDVPAGYWAARYITAAYNSGIVAGYTDGTFGPGKTVTRAQMAVMLVRACGINADSYAGQNTPFSDVSSGCWAAKYILAAYNNGIVSGYANGTFGINSPITRAQAATMLVNAAES